jgi:predicted metal-binding membrane protein
VAAASARVSPVVPAAILGAWLIAILAQATGNAAFLHHHALIEGGSPLWIAAPLFLLGWQVMIVAMMWPASLASIGSFTAGESLRDQLRPSLATFLGSYALVWTAYGLLAFLGDVALHHVVDATPWLAARPWIIEATVVSVAGAYQLSPLKRRSLTACRHPAGISPAAAPQPRRSSFALGRDLGVACLWSSWALMLLMFAEGFANVEWMAALTVVMVYETTGLHGLRAASVAGSLLLLFGAAILSTGAGAA